MPSRIRTHQIADNYGEQKEKKGHKQAVADYPKTLKTDEDRAMFVEETICDPDGCPENVLDCFATKMCNAGVPIFWEEFV